MSGSGLLCSQVDLARALLLVAQAGANVINSGAGGDSRIEFVVLPEETIKVYTEPQVLSL
jgi:hypothetical protein